MKRRRPCPTDFTIGWICPLALEYAAAKSVLDELYSEAEYTTSRIGNHEIVITCLPAGQIGTNAAAAAATRMLSAFPSLKATLLVGIAGSAPSNNVDIRLGDVVVGQPVGQYGGVVQYDFRKTIPGGFQRIGSLNAPSHELLSAVSKFKSNLSDAKESMRHFLVERPIYNADVLFEASYNHAGGETCCDCRKDKIINRVRRGEDIHIFFGTVASGNQVIKDGITRDELNSKLQGVLCFEMEAAGVVNTLPCLVIRGICDYADSHKNKIFQPFAASAAATCARQILYYLNCAPGLGSMREGTCQENFCHPSTNQPDAFTWDRSGGGGHGLGQPRQLVEEQHQLYHESLSFDQLDSRHRTIRFAHTKTCRWLLSCPEYKNWLASKFFQEHHGFLGDTLEKTVLLEKLPDLRSDIETLKYIFNAAVEKLEDRSLMCYIDALDECDKEEVRDMLSFFEQLGDLVACKQIRLLVCFSSRHYPHIMIENKIKLVLEDQDGHWQDISNYVHSELKAGRSNQTQLIKDEVISRSSGIFLWVVLVVQILNKEYDRGQVHSLKRRLGEIPDGLHALLKDILLRDNHNMEQTLLCLQWILYETRPMSVEELYFAILAGIEPDPKFLASWIAEDIDKEVMSKFVLDSSKGLAELTKSKNATIQFIHESVRDFLRDEGLVNIAAGSIAPGPSHEALKICCLRYVSIDLSSYVPPIESLPSGKSAWGRDLMRTTSLRYPFLQYAVHNVLHHANIAAKHGIAQICFLIEFPLDTWILKNNLFEKHAIRRYKSSADQIYILAEKNCAKLLEEDIRIGSPDRPEVGSCFENPSKSAHDKWPNLTLGHRTKELFEHC
ncbi:uncharacterized protein BJX67DRAFT_390638 [Aspergillus lucknowensis]|uniref:Nucleoside phosphorylase domain-containing protein n=1 Tax=Aspergillus lucknowensis TaxID=176173 RepID=A0ABR4LFR4_9EURO